MEIVLSNETLIVKLVSSKWFPLFETQRDTGDSFFFNFM